MLRIDKDRLFRKSREQISISFLKDYKKNYLHKENKNLNCSKFNLEK